MESWTTIHLDYPLVFELETYEIPEIGMVAVQRTPPWN